MPSVSHADSSSSDLVGRSCSSIGIQMLAACSSRSAASLHSVLIRLSKCNKTLHRPRCGQDFLEAQSSLLAKDSATALA